MGKWAGVLVAGGGDVEEVGGLGLRRSEVPSELDAGEGGGKEVWEEAGKGEAVQVSMGDEDDGFGGVEVGDEGGDV